MNLINLDKLNPEVPHIEMAENGFILFFENKVLVFKTTDELSEYLLNIDNKGEK